MSANACKRREENITRKYSSGLRNQNGEHIVNICELNILETLPKAFFMLKVATNNIKIKITYRSCRRWMHSEKNITYRLMKLCQSVIVI